MVKTSPIVFLGDPDIKGATYVLVIYLAEKSGIKIGKNAKKLIDFPKGNYVYIGSAIGKKGSSSIQHRLIRHATRKNGRPHEIYFTLQQQFLSFQKTQRIPSVSKRTKRLHWHIDFFLENNKTSIKKIYVIFSPNRLEERLSLLLNAHDRFVAIEKGLGASDMKQPITNLLYTDLDLQDIDRIIVDITKKHVLTESSTERRQKP